MITFYFYRDALILTLNCLIAPYVKEIEAAPSRAIMPRVWDARDIYLTAFERVQRG